MLDIFNNRKIENLQNQNEFLKSENRKLIIENEYLKKSMENFQNNIPILSRRMANGKRRIY